MSGSIKNVLIIGASGNLGPSILDALLADSRFNVTVLSRKGSKAQFPGHIKVVSVDPSFPEDELLEAFKGQDAVVDVAHLSPDTTHNKARIDAAVKAGVKRYIPSEFGSNRQDPEVMASMKPVFGGKEVVTEYLKTKESEGLTWSAVVTGPFFDWCLKFGVLGFDLKAHKATIYDAGTAKTHFTNLATVGRAVVEVLAHPAETANRFVHVDSFYISQSDILAALKKADNNPEWTVEHANSNEALKRGAEMLAKGEFAGFVPAIAGLSYSGADYNDWEKVKLPLDNKLLGLPPPNETSLEATVAEAVKSMAG